MRVAAVADLHGHLPAVPPCDLLLIAGDISPPRGRVDAGHWLDTAFRGWLEAVPAEATVGIAGNHDFAFEATPPEVPGDLPWTYLEDASCTAAGLSIWGSPWTPWFGGWAFNAPREDGEAFLADRYALAPAGTDVLVLHGPPRDYGDRITSGARVGALAAVDLIDRLEPALCAFGHIHEARGAWTRGRTRLLNAAAVDGRFRLRDDPVVLLDL